MRQAVSRASAGLRTWSAGMGIVALSDRTRSGRLRGLPSPSRGTRIASRTGSNCGESPRCPAVITTDKGFCPCLVESTLTSQVISPLASASAWSRVLPYHFALAGAPILHDGRTVGALLLLWPGPRHDLVPAVRAGAAAGYAERLPEPGVALDLDGRLTFITPGAARLVGAAGQRLLGALPWEALARLDDPVYEDRYRAAVISRRPTSFTAQRPDGVWLRFELFPDDTGITVRITEVPGPDDADAAGAPQGGAAQAVTPSARPQRHLHPQGDHRRSQDRPPHPPAG